MNISPYQSPMHQYNSLALLNVQGKRADSNQSVININDIFKSQVNSGKVRMKAKYDNGSFPVKATKNFIKKRANHFTRESKNQESALSVNENHPQFSNRKLLTLRPTDRIQPLKINEHI